MWKGHFYVILASTDNCLHAGQAERGLLLARTQGGPHRRAGHNHHAEGMAGIFFHSLFSSQNIVL